MSPTEVYKIFVSWFPSWKFKSYIGCRGDKNAIVLTNEWGQQYFFKFISEDLWIFETIKMYRRDTGRS